MHLATGVPYEDQPQHLPTVSHTADIYKDVKFGPIITILSFYGHKHCKSVDYRPLSKSEIGRRDGGNSVCSDSVPESYHQCYTPFKPKRVTSIASIG